VAQFFERRDMIPATSSLHNTIITEWQILKGYRIQRKGKRGSRYTLKTGSQRNVRTFSIPVDPRIVGRTLQAPLRCLLENSRVDLESSLQQLIESERDVGFNVSSARIEDLREQGVLDATDVVVAAVEIASLQARTILQTSSWELLLNPRHLPWAAAD
jgi:hypothetical protein